MEFGISDIVLDITAANGDEVNEVTLEKLSLKNEEDDVKYDEYVAMHDFTFDVSAMLPPEEATAEADLVSEEEIPSIADVILEPFEASDEGCSSIDHHGKHLSDDDHHENNPDETSVTFKHLRKRKAAFFKQHGAIFNSIYQILDSSCEMYMARPSTHETLLPEKDRPSFREYSFHEIVSHYSMKPLFSQRLEQGKKTLFNMNNQNVQVIESLEKSIRNEVLWLTENMNLPNDELDDIVFQTIRFVGKCFSNIYFGKTTELNQKKVITREVVKNRILQVLPKDLKDVFIAHVYMEKPKIKSGKRKRLYLKTPAAKLLCPSWQYCKLNRSIVKNLQSLKLR